MRALIYIFLIVTCLWVVSCSGITNLAYGPDLTPTQLKEAVYMDAYALGAMRASGEGQASIQRMITEAEAVGLSADPKGILTQKWLEALRAGDQKGAMVYYAVRRLYDRVGAKLLDDKFDLAGLDVDLLKYGIGAYVEGLKSMQK